MTFINNAHAQNDKTIYINAQIFDGEKIRQEDAFIVDKGKFFAFGNKSTMREQAGAKTQVVDIRQKLVMPGFIEAHAHLLGLGQNSLRLDVRNLSKEKIRDAVVKQAKQQQAGTWIKGRGWDQNLWPDKQFPRQTDLNNIDHPVYLTRVDGHAVWLNDKAMAIAGITKSTVDPEGGQIVRDAQGYPTGVLIDNAIDIVAATMAKPQRADLELHLQLGMQAALRRGITSFHDAGVSADVIQLYEDFDAQHRLPLRIYAMLDGQDQLLIDRFFNRGIKLGSFLTIRAIKYFADGALGSRGAHLLDPYHDHAHHYGLLLTDRKTLRNNTIAALNAGFQVATHAIGDSANRLVLDAYEDALAITNAHDARLRIEHAQLIDPQDHHRFKKLSIIASMQPIHCTSDMAWVPDRLGVNRIKNRAYPWRSLLNEGAVLAFGSDAPVENINPILGLYAATTRSSLENITSFMPEQKLTLAEALRGFYYGAAYAEFNETNKGKISENFVADFIVLDTDIIHPIKSTFTKASVLMTIVDGKIVFQRE